MDQSVQIGNPCWELYCLEHGIHPDGQMCIHSTKTKTNCNFNIFFNEREIDKHVPRAVLVDLKSTAAEDIQNDRYEYFLHVEEYDKLRKEPLATRNGEVVNLILSRLRNITAQCTGLQGFLIFHSFGGGTNSDLISILMERLSLDVNRNYKLELEIDYPQIPTTIVEPYGSKQTLQINMEHLGNGSAIDEDTLYDICRSNIINYATYVNLNKLLGQIVSFIAASTDSTTPI